jgi:hypothetical protein
MSFIAHPDLSPHISNDAIMTVDINTTRSVHPNWCSSCPLLLNSVHQFDCKDITVDRALANRA